MKKLLFIILAAVLVIGTFAIGCGEQTATTTTETATATATETATATSTETATTTATATVTAEPTTEPGPTPDHGGRLTIITTSGPQVLGGFEGGPADLGAVFPALDAVLAPSPNRDEGIGLEASLAESYDDDIDNKKIVIKLREGVLYHDGTEMTAETVLWGVDRAIENGRWTYMDLWEGYTIVDKYTFEFHYNMYNNQLIQNWCWLFPRSQAAYEAGSGGDEEQGRIWDRENIVGTGPFKIGEYVRDDHLLWVKNQDYWQDGLPYLDEVYVRYIPDPVTAKALMEAGEGDYWMGPQVVDQIILESKGFDVVTGWVGLVMSIWPNTSDPESIWNDVRLRQAMDYALDKGAIAEALGMGRYDPLYQLAPPGEWGYRPDYAERRYDPDKARELLAEAGFPNGLTETLILQNTPANVDACTIIQQMLGAVGIVIELDVADPGRFYGTVWGAAQPGLSWMWSGMDITNLMTYQRWFSTDPFTDLVYLGHTPEQAALDAESLLYPDRDSQIGITERLFAYLDDGAYLIPVYRPPQASVKAPYVHTSIPQFVQGFVRFQYEMLWIEAEYQ